MKRKPIPNKLNIGIVAKKFPLIGRATDHGFLWPIAKGLVARGHDVTIFSTKNPQGKEKIVQDGVTAYYLTNNSRYKEKIFSEIVKDTISNMHKENFFDIIHSIDDSGKKIGKIKKDLKLALAYDIEATQMSQVFSIMALSQETISSLIKTGLAVLYKFISTYLYKDRKILKKADGVFVTSPLQKITLERYYLYPDAKTYTVPYGIDIDNLKTESNTEKLQSDLKIPESTRVIVTLSDMSELGEIKNLLSAFQKITIKKPNTKLIIIGNGPFKNEVEYEMYQLALGNKVILTGAINNNDLADYISLCDIYVNLSSRTSGFEPSMLEAMAQEKVIIGSEISPISTIVEDGKDGFLLRPADTQNLVRLILNIFSDELSVTEIGMSAKRKILDLFDTDRMVEQTLSAYYDILKNTGYYTK